MKYVTLQYPNNNNHNIIVYSYSYSTDLNKEFMYYYDLTKSRKMYTVLEKVDNKIYRNPFTEEYTFEQLIRNATKLDEYSLPNTIECLPNNYNTDNSDLFMRQSQSMFIVYHNPINNKYYTSKEICEKYNIGEESINIYGFNCNEVTKEEINYIEKQSEEEEISLKAIFKNMELEISQVILKVFYDLDNNVYYTSQKICDKFNLGTGKYLINNDFCRKITKEEIENIENKSLKYNPSIRVNIENISFKNNTNNDNKESNSNIFKVYHDIDNNRYFTSYELCEKYNVGKGNIILNNNRCKRVTREEIKTIEESNNRLKADYKYVSFKEKDNSDKNIIKVTVYKDKNNNRLYLSREDCNKYNLGNTNSFKYINNIECLEITIKELSLLHNSEYKDNRIKVKAQTVHLLKDNKIKEEVTEEVTEEINKEDNKQEEKQPEKVNIVEKEFLVARYQDKYYISKEYAEIFKIDYDNSINVNSIPYVQVTEDKIDYIEEITKNFDERLVRRISDINPKK